MTCLIDLWMNRPPPTDHRCTAIAKHVNFDALSVRCHLPAGHAGAHAAPLHYFDAPSAVRIFWPADDGDAHLRVHPHPERPQLFPIRSDEDARTALRRVWLALDQGEISPWEARDVIAAAQRQLETQG